MNNKKRIWVASDHGGYSLKAWLIEALANEFPDLDIEDLGCHSEQSVDYPDFAGEVGRRVAGEPNSLGLLICGSGIGMSIAANKVAGVRAAVIWDETSARLSREHNDTNVLCLGARLLGPELAKQICRVWFQTPFAGGRHQRRVDKIEQTGGTP